MNTKHKKIRRFFPRLEQKKKSNVQNRRLFPGYGTINHLVKKGKSSFSSVLDKSPQRKLMQSKDSA